MSEILEQFYDAVVKLEAQDGFSPSRLLELSPELADIMGQIVRKNGLSLSAIAGALKHPSEDVEKILVLLTEKGYIRKVKIRHEWRYKARFKRQPDKIFTQNRGNVDFILDDVISGDS